MFFCRAMTHDSAGVMHLSEAVYMNLIYVSPHAALVINNLFFSSRTPLLFNVSFKNVKVDNDGKVAHN